MIYSNYNQVLIYPNECHFSYIYAFFIVFSQPYMKEMPEKIKKKNKKEKSNSNHVNIDSISDKSYNQINGRVTILYPVLTIGR